MTAVFLVGVQLFISWTQSRQAAGQAPLLPALAKRQHAVQGIAVPSYSGRIKKLKQFPSNLDPRLSDPRSGLVLGAPVPFGVSSHGESEHE